MTRKRSIHAKAMQEFIIVLIFAVAVGYLSNRAYRSFSKKEAGCGKGCGCAADAKPTVAAVKERL